MDRETVTLFRPTGERELALIRSNEWKGFPPRLPDQPFFYPVLNEEHATQMAFKVDAGFIGQYDVRTVGSGIHKEYWIPAADLHELNRHVVGAIELIGSYTGSETK